MNKSIERYSKLENALYSYKLEQARNAAESYAAACSRCGADWNRMTIVQFCANTFPDMKISDALEIAGSIRGRYI